MIRNKSTLISTCFHCGDDCLDTALRLEEKMFCCQGCMTVYGILHQNKLDHYYCLNPSPGATIKQFSNEKWDALFESSVAKNYITFKDENLTKAVFYLPQMHCSSCVWLLEHLHKINKSIVFSEVNFTNKKIYISFNSNSISLPAIAALLESVGYEPYLEKGSINAPIESTDSKINIGIAGFCFINIMILSFPEYLGLSKASDQSLLAYFRSYSLLLALPVFYISVRTFFKKAWQGIQNKFLNIDFPVALAILVTFIRSVYEISGGHGSGYLDSMSGIVFFMLLGRFVQDKTNHSLNFERNFTSFFPLNTTLKVNNQLKSISVNSILPNQVLVLKYGELLPVDGILSVGQAKIDYSYITGESEYQTIHTGQLIYAGGRVVESSIEMVAIKSFSQSDFIQIWNQPAFYKASNNKPEWTDTVSRYFTMMVILLASISFLYWYSKGSTGIGLNALTATLIIACPCALLLSATFTHGFMLNILSNTGIYFKNASLFAELNKINHVVFDKTGTLTYRIADRVKLLFSSWDKEDKEVALTLISYTNHPMAKSIIDFEQFYHSGLKIKDFKEVEGFGIEGWINDHYFKIGNSVYTGQQKWTGNGSFLYIVKDQKCIAVYSLEYQFKSGVALLLNRLRSYKLTLLSGDKNTSNYLNNAQLPSSMEICMGKSPMEKLEYIEQNQKTGSVIMMVGDGLNDVGALKQSDLGIALASEHFSFTPSCDIIMQESNLTILDSLFTISQKLRLLILVSFGYSLIFNIGGLYFAISGELRPVIAAILMPLSSLGVIALAYWGTLFIKNKYLKFKI